MKKFILCSLLILAGCATVNSNSNTSDKVPKMKIVCKSEYGTVYSHYVINHGYIFVYESRVSNIAGSITSGNY